MAGSTHDELVVGALWIYGRRRCGRDQGRGEGARRDPSDGGRRAVVSPQEGGLRASPRRFLREKGAGALPLLHGGRRRLHERETDREDGELGNHFLA